VPASLVRKTIGLLGCQFSILFGQTETHGRDQPDPGHRHAEDQAGTVGQPLPQLEVKIADMMTGTPVPETPRVRSAAGATRTCGATTNRPAETGATIDADGWLHMGDIGVDG